MKKIAVILEDDLFDQKGSFNAKFSRVAHLLEIADYQIDVYFIQLYRWWLVRWLLGRRALTLDGKMIPERNLRHRNELEISGVTIYILWQPYSILDHFLFFKLKVRPVFYPLLLKRWSKRLAGYDLVSGHSFEGAFLACEAQKRFGMPYTASWHGSDIHTKPFRYPCIFPLTRTLLEAAACNFFVSRNLLETSDKVGGGHKEVLYNGVSERFCRYPDVRREEFRKAFGATGRKVVTFAGGLARIKNAGLLPELFRNIQRLSAEKVLFWVIGDGKMRKAVETEIAADGVLDCRFWGNQPAEKMPDFFNCTDVLVLPSRNESFGMVLVEAIRCGANAVGSAVGGIPEVLGTEYVIPTGPDFVEHFSCRVAELLSHPVPQTISPVFDWKVSASAENACYEQLTGLPVIE